MMALVPGAATGTIYSVTNGYDMGISKITAFLYNRFNDTYEAVLLREGGSYTKTNSAPEAAVLIEWLTDVWW